MKCPFRGKTTYEFEKYVVEGKPIIKSTYEEWPDCYEDDCPFWNTYSAGNCTKVEQSNNEE